MELTRLAVSENIRAASGANPLLEIEATIDLEFDTTGNLISPFVEVAAHGRHPPIAVGLWTGTAS